MEPIATYTESTLSGKRKYELYPDKIVIKGAVSWSYDFESAVVLNRINSEYTRLRIRPLVAWIALTTSILTGFASFVLVHDFGVSSTVLPGVLGIYSGSAFIVAIATIKKVEYARFCSDDYRTVLLSIARSGPDKNQFDSFIQALSLHIGEARGTGQHVG